ncbi:DctP family TRAP transporter solute-binding subunit [Ferviditalea candida]|uniref:DctP family TRAP transporter solute-binding subunit n=1 Tax=Ferviditalea candida TaxID=3108399 RepID=A0ABU5ZI92_9BACL|nr:DctP family TRAP transporter solute-binding subunit [Paenibacillaceae bacterium T2]
MKSFLTISLFVIIGLITAVLVGFRENLFAENIPYDAEQEGLNQQIIIKFSHVVAENTPKGLAALKFASIVKEKSGGQIEVQVFPNGMLYSESQGIDALRNGDIQMIAPAFSNLSLLIPQWLAMDLPYAFPNQKAVEEAFNGEIGAELFRTLESRNMKGLAFWSNGFKQMTNNRNPLISPEDFKQLNFRIMPSEVIAAQFRLLGARSTPLAFNEVYRSLLTGTVDGQENTISNIYTKRLYQTQNYMTLSNHGYLGYVVIINKPFWEGLPKQAQRIIRQAMEETTAWMNDQAVKMNQEQLELIRHSSDIKIDELDAAEREQWIKALEPVYRQFAPIIGEPLTSRIQSLRKKYIESAD